MSDDISMVLVQECQLQQEKKVAQGADYTRT
jgi:hypothetical protein